MINVVNFEKHESPYDGLLNGITHTNLIGDSISSQYVPFISGFTGEVYKIGETKKVLVYDFFHNKHDIPERVNRRYDELFYSLSKCVVPSWYHSKEVDLQSCKGMLYHLDMFTGDYKLLMILAIKSDYVFKMDKNKPDYKQFALFLSNDFTDEKLYQTIYNKIEKEYVTEARNLGIDIVYTKHIKERCFSHTFIKPKFSSILEMQKAMKNINKTLLDG